MENKSKRSFEEWAKDNLPLDANERPYCGDHTDPLELWQAAVQWATAHTEEKYVGLVLAVREALDSDMAQREEYAGRKSKTLEALRQALSTLEAV